MKPNDKAIEAGVKLCWDCPRATPSMIRDILTAAYAAQFPPSDDYAELIETLRSSSPYTLSHVAADALEAVLAEREALRKWKEDDSAAMRIFARYRELEAEVAAWKGRQEATAAILKRVETERDALLARFTTESALRGQLLQQQSAIGPDARLAPVDDEALVEIVADAIDTPLPSLTWEEREGGARAAIAAIRPHIEAAERERCAKAVEKVAGRINVPLHERPEWEDGYLQAVHDAAAAIRSGK